jgi:Polyketide cyclase / dehydrase and lipid transport
MWQKSYTVATEVPSSRLWEVIADVANWSSWDEEIEFIQIDGLPRWGTEFCLKPKGAPAVKLTIEEFSPPHRFVDVTQFPLAQMRTIHEFRDTSTGTEIKVTVQVWGVLGFLWQKIVAQKQVEGLSAQTQKFIDRACKTAIYS